LLGEPKCRKKLFFTELLDHSRAAYP